MGIIRMTSTLATVNPEWCRKHTKGSTHRGSKGREGAQVSGLNHSLWNYCVRDSRAKMCTVENRAGGDVVSWEPSGGSHQPVPALLRVRLYGPIGDLQWIAGGRILTS